MRKLQKQRISKITRKILPFALAVGVAGLTLFPGCRTPNPNQFKNKQTMGDNMEKQEKKEERKIGTLGIPTLKKNQEEKKEEKSKPKETEQIQKMQGVGPLPAPPYKKLKPRQPIH